MEPDSERENFRERRVSNPVTWCQDEHATYSKTVTPCYSYNIEVGTLKNGM